jgi:hypothetical protein
VVAVMDGDHTDYGMIVFAAFFVWSIGGSFCVCLHNAAYNLAHPVAYLDIFQLHGIAGF